MSASIWAPGASIPVVDPNSEVRSQIFTALAGQTLFNITLFTYAVGAQAIEVFKNGLKLASTSVTETSSSSFTLAACTVGDVVEVVGNVEIANAANSAVQSAASASAALVSQNAAAVSAAAALVSQNSAAASAAVSFMQWRGAWVTATAYAINNGVSINGASYVCVSAHTSGTFATDLAGAKWQVLAAKGTDGLGSGDMLAANNLSDLTNIVTARTNLGLGTAATQASGAFATSGHNHAGVYEPADATILKNAALGVTAQPYDANTAKLNAVQAFTKVQSCNALTASVSATGTFTFDPSTHGQDCEVTLTNAITVTLAAAAGKIVAGTYYTIVLKAGDTSARAFAKGATVLAPAATLPITSGSVTSGGRDVFHLRGVDANTVMVIGSSADVR